MSSARFGLCPEPPSTQLGCAKMLGPQRDSPAGTQQARPHRGDGGKMERGMRETVEERKCEGEGKRKQVRSEHLGVKRET